MESFKLVQVELRYQLMTSLQWQQFQKMLATLNQSLFIPITLRVKNEERKSESGISRVMDLAAKFLTHVAV